ncbi:hypothetical protein TOPH_08985 [Tolypocladium ophioglossoides CBS 100239]|uniref:Oxidoreductase-like protein n=1 Tax=Tolypocladium ophioglossoides (strain CBS 100239) TaxID=1163406 RepID=A0A0L0MWZ9_TOLOC|nr:hypothetical protein TOPH_08985 [Tolypocladium ophioglossoides CBS 100239]
MEARSLASLNSLAANPPQYPEKPGEERQDPLVLYISRVPGTRDIILSPFKPQIKNVTAEDVAASLYYVHLEMPCSDLSARMPIRVDELSRSSEDSASPLAIPRKPLPDSVRPLTPESLSSGNRLQPPRTLHFQPADDSGLGLADSAELPQRPLLGPQTAMPVRKPLGPRPMANLPASSPEKALPALPQDCSALEESAHATDQWRDRVAQRNPRRSPSPKKHGRRSSAGAPFTLVLIRRDPGSGNQWNVGRVSSRQFEAPSTGIEQPGAQLFAPQPPPTGASPPIDVEIETSGYAKFRGMPPRKSVDVGLEAALSAAAGDPAPRNDIGVFSRQVVMRYSKSLTASIKEKFQRIEHAGRSRLNHGRSGSTASVDSAMSAGPAGELHGLKARGYTFTSPWDGKCEFRTGTGGRSVQCRHTLYDGGAAAYNPLIADQGSTAPRSGATTVSELRFNLPGSELLGEQTRSAKDQWRGNFSKLLKPNHDGDGDDGDDDDVVSPFEVNVGSERAGGGNRGSRAKLGKLIIYNDGLKMLDLVVAANIGVWWGAWEKTF